METFGNLKSIQNQYTSCTFRWQGQGFCASSPIGPFHNKGFVIAFPKAPHLSECWPRPC